MISRLRGHFIFPSHVFSQTPTTCRNLSRGSLLTMSPTDAEEEKFALQQDSRIDLEALRQSHHRPANSPIFDNAPSRMSLRRPAFTTIAQKFFSYPSPDALQIRPTSWLDGVRGVAALGVYLFHAMGLWAAIVPAWRADESQNHFLQLPLIRTLFVAGGPAVSLFFVLSGYVLTQKSLRWMRKGQKQSVYPAVASSMFRRGFRLYLPPILLTFCEMIGTRFGFNPPLNFTFVPEKAFSAQFLDWLQETNRLINPFINAVPALQGVIKSHPKYDAVVWTIPLEFYGSMVCYTLLVTLAWVPSSAVRMTLVAMYSVSCMMMGSWNLFCFSAGILLADFHLGQEDSGANPSPRHSKPYMALFAAGFYAAGFPSLGKLEARSNPMPGFETLYSLTPNFGMDDPSRFWWSLSGVSLLLSISQLPRLKRVFESNLCQYLGKISFALYLVHEFCIILFGLTMQSIIMRILGVVPGSGGLTYWIVCLIWFSVFSFLAFGIAGQVQRWVDEPSVKFAKWLEQRCLKILCRG
ncbi:acyltransferase family-domain-containing protein [Amylocarpus encephaloides]|uniref:Acyltransferase family-domain-containing protein n=1 Tax=Amylocarpus encephaloides TaxID=45428 RepID=A0A9P7YIX7_9HELO|nr:acyltransferase family-domain-containing protein [Amylocarpus encephaloides]